MKKHFFKFIAISGILFLTACSDTTNGNTSETKSETKVQKVDSVKKTTISISPDGAGVKSKNTEVQVNSGGANVSTKDVKVDVKSGK